MCEFASLVLTSDREFWSPRSDSHETIIEDNRLHESSLIRNLLRVMILPPCGDKLAPLHAWSFVVDQDVLPEWASKDLGEAERRARLAFRDCYATRVRVDETFEPDPQTAYVLLHGCNVKYIAGRVETLSECSVGSLRAGSNVDRAVKCTIGYVEGYLRQADACSIDSIYGRIKTAQNQTAIGHVAAGGTIRNLCERSNVHSCHGTIVRSTGCAVAEAWAGGRIHFNPLPENFHIRCERGSAVTAFMGRKAAALLCRRSCVVTKKTLEAASGGTRPRRS
jgi:hypothetical protein